MSNKLSEIRKVISNNKFTDAIKMLKGVAERDGEWHYLFATANYGAGNNIQALSHAKQALVMEPDVPEYSDLVMKMSYRDDRYRREREYRSGGCGCCGGDCCDCCCDLWCADTCCECMGGDLCECM